MNYQTTWQIDDYKKIDEKKLLSNIEIQSGILITHIDNYIHKYKKIEPESFASFIDRLNELMTNEELDKQILTLMLHKHLNQSNTALVALENKVEEKTLSIKEKLNELSIYIQKQSEEVISIIESHPKLDEYRNWLKSIYEEREHTLDIKEENLLSYIGSLASDSWYELISVLLSSSDYEKDGKKYILTEALKLLYSADENSRKLGGDIITNICKKNSKVAERSINNFYRYGVLISKKRKYSSFESSRFINDQISEDAVNAMISSVEKNINLSHKFYDIKRRLLSKDKIKYWDRSAPITDDKTKKIEEQTLIQSVGDIMQQLDPEFLSIYRQIVNGNLDLHPKQDKYTGAFCTSPHITLGTYILMNYSGTTHDIITLAHEMGHAINYELMKQQRSSLTYSVQLSIAEVASTFFEDLSYDYLLEKYPEDKFKLLTEMLENYITTIFRQIALFKFEKKLYNLVDSEGFVSLERINKHFNEHMSWYFGDSVDMDEDAGYWWIYWNHLYYNFYVYSYASGKLLSNLLLALVQMDSNNIIKVKELLRTGMYKTPTEIFKSLDINLNDPNTWDIAFSRIEVIFNNWEKEALKRINR